MGDTRFESHYRRVKDAEDPVAEIRALTDEAVVAALAAASKKGDPYLANVLASEAQNRARRKDAVFHNARDGVVILDRAGRVSLANPAAEELLGWAEGALVGRAAEDLFAPPGAEDGAAGCGVRGALRSGAPEQRFAETLPRADGSTFPGDYLASPIKVDGEVEGAVVIFQDVTERVRAERARSRLAAIVESTDDAVLSKDLDTIITSWNPAAERLYGYTEEEAVGQPVAIIVPPERAGEEKDILDRVVRGEHVDHYETERVAKDGRRISVWLTVSAIHGANGEVVGASAIARDITELKRAQAALRESHALLETLLQGAPVGIAFHDRELRFVHVNEAMARINGATVEEHLGRTLDDVVPPAIADAVRPRLLQVLESGAPSLGVEMAGESPAHPGETRHWVVSHYPVRTDAGHVLGVGVVVEDVTESRRAEAEIHAAHARVTTILESITDAFIAMDREWRFTYVNDEAERLLQRPREELLGQVVWEEFPDALDLVFHDAYQRAMETGEAAHFEAHYPPLDVWFEVHAYPSKDGLSVYFRDVTDRRATEAAVRSERQRLRAVLEALPVGVFIADGDGRLIEANDAGREVWGDPPLVDSPEEYGEFKAWRPGTGERVAAEEWGMARALKRGEATVGEELEIETFDGARKTILHSAVPIMDEGRVVGGVVTNVDITPRKRAERGLAQRARQQAVVAELGRRALSGAGLQDLFDDAVAQVADTLDVEYCKVLDLLPGGEELLLRAGVGWREGLVGAGTVGAGLDSQAGFTLQSDDPVIVEDLREETRFTGPPLLHDHGVVSGISVVIRGEAGRPWGVMGAHTTQRRAFTGDDVNFLQAVANVLAEAIQRKHADAERARLLARERAARADAESAAGRFAFLADAGEVLASSLDYEETLERLAWLAVPDFADWCFVDLVAPDHGYRRIAVAHADPAHGDLARTFRRDYPPRPGADAGVAWVAENRRDLFLPDVPDGVFREVARDANHLRALRASGITSAISVPMEARGRVVGVLTLCTSGDRPHYTEEDLHMARELARHAALAVDNARLHQEVQESDSRLRFALDAAEIGEWDLDLKTHQATRSLLHDQIFGYESPPPEWTYEMFLEHVLPEDREAVDRGFRRTFEAREPWDFECRIRRVDGEVRRIHAQGHVYAGDGGEARRMVGIVEDVTEARRAGERLRFQGRILDAVGEAAIATDVDGTITYWNRAAEEMYGWSAEEAVGRAVQDVVVAKGTRQEVEAVMDRMRAGEPWSGEITVRRKDGTAFPALVTTTPVRDEEGHLEGFVGVSRDVTEARQAQEALRERDERLRRLMGATAAGLQAGRDDGDRP